MRADPNSILRTYEWLSTEVRRTVNLDQMRKNFQERDDRMKELSQGKVKVAVGKEEDQNKRPKRDRSVKVDKKDPAPAATSSGRAAPV